MEGQEPGLTPADRTTSEKRTSGKARAASGTRFLLKQFSLERSRRKWGRCQSTGTQDRSDRQGEDAEGLPGSKSVARVEEGARNRGGPGHSCRTNYAGQAGKVAQRQGVRPEGAQGVGSAHSNQWQGASPDAGEGADVLAKLTQATRAVRFPSLWDASDYATTIFSHHRALADRQRPAHAGAGPSSRSRPDRCGYAARTAHVVGTPLTTGVRFGRPENT